MIRLATVVASVLFINSASVAGMMIASFDDLGVWSDLAPKINASGTVVGLIPIMNEQGEYEQRIAIAPVNGATSFVGPVFPVNHVFNIGINDSDVVLASYQVGSEFRATLFHPTGEVSHLDGLSGLGLNFAYAMNNSNVVVGGGSFPASSQHAYRWSQANGYQDLGSFGGFDSIGFGINDAGTVVGYASGADHVVHAFRYTDKEGMVDLGTLGGEASIAKAVNERGAVVGVSDVPGMYDTQVAFFHDDEGGMVAMEDDPAIRFSEALDINNNDWAVGHAWRHDEDVFFTFGFLWTPEAGFVDLNTLLDESADFFIESATSINDAGQIVGMARRDDGQGFLYRLTITSIPSPTAAPLLLGFFALHRRRRDESG